MLLDTNRLYQGCVFYVQCSNMLVPGDLVRVPQSPKVLETKDNVDDLRLSQTMHPLGNIVCKRKGRDSK